MHGQQNIKTVLLVEYIKCNVGASCELGPKMFKNLSASKKGSCPCLQHFALWKSQNTCINFYSELPTVGQVV